MNIIDRDFDDLVKEIKALNKNELYYRIRTAFDKIPNETKESCKAFFNKFNYWGILDFENNNYEEIEKKAEVLYHHIDDFVWVYKHLNDYRSKKTLYSILSNWYRYDFKTTFETQEKLFDDYFDLDLVKCEKNEVIVDLGAYTGDTILSYIKNYGSDCYKKIYCYEITPDTFEILKKNLESFPNIDVRRKGISNTIETLKLVTNEESPSANTLKKDLEGNISMTTLDEDIKEKITLIKADIEGFEQKAILGSKNHIINDKPKLLISVYHKNDDLWKIPKMIYELNPNYKLYLRYKGSHIYPTEITLFAI